MHRHPRGAHGAGRDRAPPRSAALLAGVKQALQEYISDELGRAAPAAVSALAESLAHRGGGAVAAVLYYGSTLRTDALEGMLDFYVLVDDVWSWPGSAWRSSPTGYSCRNVGYLEYVHQGQVLRAKYAVLEHSLGFPRAAASGNRWILRLYGRGSASPCFAYGRVRLLTASAAAGSG